MDRLGTFTVSIFSRKYLLKLSNYYIICNLYTIKKKKNIFFRYGWVNYCLTEIVHNNIPNIPNIRLNNFEFKMIKIPFK